MTPLLPSLADQLTASLQTATDSLTLAHTIHQSLAQFLLAEHPWRPHTFP